MESLGEFGELRRLSVVDFVSSLRPARLIGTVLPLCTWKDYFKSNINKIRVVMFENIMRNKII